MFRKGENKGKKPVPVKEIKLSTTYTELEILCKESKRNEEEVRGAILRILKNELDRLTKVQALSAGDRKTVSLATPIIQDISSLNSLVAALESGNLATQFKQWKDNNSPPSSKYVKAEMLASLENIVQCEFVSGEVKKEGRISSLLNLFQQPASSNLTNDEKNESSTHSMLALFHTNDELDKIPDLDNIDWNKFHDEDIDFDIPLNLSQSSSSSSSQSIPSNPYADANSMTAQTFDKLQIFVKPESAKQILDTIEGKNEAAFVRVNKTTASIPDKLNSQDLLAQLTNKMHEFEQFKYSNPPWNYRRLESENEKCIVKIDFYPDQMPTDEAVRETMWAEEKKNSLVVRKLSILSGIATMLDSNSFITDQKKEKEQIRDEITRLSNDIISGRMDNVSFKSFVDQLGKDIGQIVHIKKDEQIKTEILDPIRRAERYFTADYNKNMVLMAVTHRKDGSKKVQMDIELNHQVTLKQRENYITIHKSDKPKWFTSLPPCEQKWYRDRVPETIDDKAWEEFEKLFKSSAMQQAPGLANFRANFSIVQRPDGAVKTLSTALQSGVPANYEMTQEEMEKHARRNIEQKREIAVRFTELNFKQLWGDYFGNFTPPIPILFQSLLSPKTLSAAADDKLIQAQSAAMASVPDRLNYPNHQIMLHNNPTNAFRAVELWKSNVNAIKAQYKDSSREDHNWGEMKNIRDGAKQFVNSIFEKCRDQTLPEEKIALQVFLTSKNSLSAPEMAALKNLIEGNENRLGLTLDQKAAVLKIICAEDECKKLEIATTTVATGDVRNKEEYKIAAKRFLVEAMAGILNINCKSGKDRTGLSEIYQTTMIEFFEENGTVISFNAGKDSKDEAGKAQRERFCQSYEESYSSKKIEEAAGFNTPGANGIKANEYSGLMEPGIRTRKNMEDQHKKSVETACTNKPEDFTKLEKRQLTKKDKTERVDPPTMSLS